MDGFLLINKEKGVTSHDVVNSVRKILWTKKVGHAGTLDPIAEGLLILGINKGTRLLEYIVGLEKTYKVTMQLGETSDSYDSTGVVKQTRDYKSKLDKLTEDDIRKEIMSFEGEISQTPPAFSAIKINGHRAYKLAREGKEVNIKSRKITIYKIDDIVIANEIVTFNVSCSSGTYIRSLVHDIGKNLGIGAIMTELNRTKIGSFDLCNSHNIKDVSEKDVMSLSQENLKNHLKYSVYDLSFDEKKEILNGRVVSCKENSYDFSIGKDIFTFFEGMLLAVCKYDAEENLLKPKKVLNL